MQYICLTEIINKWKWLIFTGLFITVQQCVLIRTLTTCYSDLDNRHRKLCNAKVLKWRHQLFMLSDNIYIIHTQAYSWSITGQSIVIEAGFSEFPATLSASNMADVPASAIGCRLYIARLFAVFVCAVWLVVWNDVTRIVTSLLIVSEAWVDTVGCTFDTWKYSTVLHGVFNDRLSYCVRS